MALSRNVLMQTATVVVKDLHDKLSAKIRMINCQQRFVSYWTRGVRDLM